VLSALLLIQCDTQNAEPPPGSSLEPIDWESPSRVPIDVEGFPTSPDLAVSSGEVVMAFHDVRDGTPYDAPGDVYVTRRLGAGWSEAVNVSMSDVPSSAPVLAAGPGSRVHLVWGERRADATSRPSSPPDALYYAQSADGGRSWSTPERVFSSSSDGFFSPPRSLVLDADGHPHIVFSSQEWEGMPVTVKHTERRASGWTDITEVAVGGSPDLARTSDGELVVAFLRADTSQSVPDRNSLFLSRSADGGETWVSPQLVERSGVDRPAQSPRLEGGPGHRTLYLGWRRSTDGDLDPDSVFVASSGDGGETWTPSRVVPVSASGTPSAPEIVVDGSGVANIAFQVGGIGATTFPAFFARCAETSCADPVNLFRTEGAGSRLGLIAENGRYFVALRAVDLAEGRGIYFSTSETAGPS